MIDRTVSDVQAGYDLVAEEYARRLFEELQHKPLDRQLLDRFATSVRDLGPACDMGCGPGHVARYLQGRGVQVSGVDLSAAMVAPARELNPGIEFSRGDMRSLDIADEALGGIVAFYSIIHIPRPEVVTALSEMRRVRGRGARCSWPSTSATTSCTSTIGGGIGSRSTSTSSAPRRWRAS